jgi:ABC-type Zn uptake system ZnuABC Zn-binding protein ZnuA
MKQLKFWGLPLLVMSIFLATGCAPTTSDTQTETAVSAQTQSAESQLAMLSLPELTTADLNGVPLKVVATTSIIGDVVAQVGGDVIDLTMLMQPGQDPHSYEPGAQDLTAVAAADIIFVNGWDLEETLVHNLESIGQNVPMVPISANIMPLAFGGDKHNQDSGESDHSAADPHTWFSIQNVQQWVENSETVLSQRDPEHADIYAQNAATYQAELEKLSTYAEAELGSIPPEKRFLITNHDSLGYLAQAYNFEVLGTVIPGTSTLSEPSAKDMAALIAVMNEYHVCTLFTETTVSDSLAKTVAAELTDCEAVNVVSLYTGSLGPVGSGAGSYIEMFRANVDAIVAGLK